MTTTPRKVLIISLTTDLAFDELAEELLSYGYELVRVNSVDAGQGWMTTHGLPHLIVLDLERLGAEGLKFAEQIFETSGMPIIMISAPDSSIDPVQALQFADDFIRRQFATQQELSLRIRRVLSRIQNFSYAFGPQIQIMEGITVDHLNRQLVVQGESRKLTPTENALLEVLLAHRGQVVEAETLIEGVWRLDPSIKDRNALRVHLHRLRNKIEPDPDDPQLIATVRGIGYTLVDVAK